MTILYRTLLDNYNIKMSISLQKKKAKNCVVFEDMFIFLWWKLSWSSCDFGFDEIQSEDITCSILVKLEFLTQTYGGT